VDHRLQGRQLSSPLIASNPSPCCYVHDAGRSNHTYNLNILYLIISSAKGPTLRTVIVAITSGRSLYVQHIQVSSAPMTGPRITSRRGPVWREISCISECGPRHLGKSGLKKETSTVASCVTPIPARIELHYQPTCFRVLFVSFFLHTQISVEVVLYLYLREWRWGHLSTLN
jgi:hypothetical protein